MYMKDLMAIKIPPAVMAILRECDDLDPFARELLLISRGKFKESLLANPLERAAIMSIAEATEETHARRVAAGAASAKSRLAVSDLKDIVVPEIVTPSYMRGRTICGQNVTPKLLGNVRYVMLACNFGPDEPLMFLNYTFSELIKNGIPTPSGEEIMCKAKQW